MITHRLYTGSRNSRNYDCIYEYNGDFYTEEGLNNNDLYIVDDDIYYIDDVCWPEDTGDIELISNCYCHSDGNYYTYEEERKGLKLKSYHGSNIAFEQNYQPSGWRIGFEIEKVDSEVLSEGDNYDINKFGWDVEQDSSLSEGGFELISKVYDLHSDLMLSEIKDLRYYINADFDKTCGGHINISCDRMNKEELLAGVKLRKKDMEPKGTKHSI
jgi:hypothetical protein